MAMLIYTVSLELQLPPCMIIHPHMIIHNQCSKINLVSPIYFGNGAVCPKLSDQQIDVNAKTRVCFEINATQDDFGGALLYELQRYVKSDNRRNMNILTTEINENDAKRIQMLAAWKVEGFRLSVLFALIEHTKKFTWNRVKLKKLYYENRRWLKRYVSTTLDTWSMDNNVALKTTFKVRYLEGNFYLSISISEGENDGYAVRPIWTNTER
jgi:hypothetical protein